METIGAIAAYLGSALLAAGVGLGLVLGPAALALALTSVTSSFSERNLLFLLGPRAYLATFGWLGTAVHELSHALMCLVFRHRVTELRLFDPSLKKGAIGYVEHEWTPGSLYQKIGNFFIGIAPLIMGSGLLAGAGWLLLDGTGPSQVPGTLYPSNSLLFDTFHHAADAIAALASAACPTDWRWWLLLYLAIAVGASINLSLADLEGSLHGLGLIALATALFYLATHWAWDWNAILAGRIAAIHGPLLALLLLVSGLNLAVGLVAFALRRLLRGQTR
ncbi:MAG TPA: hypothetical protein VM285_03650 [Polyangia bacterium]|nr:hypothetical protein [Polyangia bacterium]